MVRNHLERSTCRNSSTRSQPRAASAFGELSLSTHVPLPSPQFFKNITSKRTFFFKKKKKNTSNEIFLFLFYISGSRKEAVKVWNFLSLVCLLGEGPSGTPALSVSAERFPAPLPRRAGVSASSPTSGSLLTPVLLFQCPSLICSWAPLRPGASGLPTLADT